MFFLPNKFIIIIIGWLLIDEGDWGIIARDH